MLLHYLSLSVNRTRCSLKVPCWYFGVVHPLLLGTVFSGDREALISATYKRAECPFCRLRRVIAAVFLDSVHSFSEHLVQNPRDLPNRSTWQVLQIGEITD